MFTTTDSHIRPSVEKNMVGNLILDVGETDEIIIAEYFQHPYHSNWVIDDDINGFLCVTEYDDYVIVNFAWFTGEFGHRKKMVKMGKRLYQIHTVGDNKPIYYSGKKNLYPNHSITIANNVWQFIA